MKEKEIINKIEALPKEKIDELFYRCGWKDEERGSNKSLPSWRIKDIKSGKGKELIKTFIQEIGPEIIFNILLTIISKS